MARIILHADMDAFFAAVEQRDRPELRGQPVVVGSPPDQRGVVAASSYEARRFGIHSAMPSREAGRRCPHAVFLPPDMKRYARVSRQVMAIFGRFTPLVEPVSIDEAFLDVTGAQRLFGDGAAIAARIRQAVKAETQLTVSVGVAANKFLAKLASDMHKPDGLTVVPADPAAIRAFLAPLPVGRMWGVGKVSERVLTRAGFHTIADIQRAPPSHLARLLGHDAAAHLYALAHGEDARTVEVTWDEKSISRENTFLDDVTDVALLERTLVDLVEDVGRRLRKAGKYAGLAKLKLRWKDFTTFTRQVPLVPPRCDDYSLRAAAQELFAAEKLLAPVRLIGFGVGQLTLQSAGQLNLFETAGQPVRVEAVSRTVDTIRKKYGAAAILSAEAKHTQPALKKKELLARKKLTPGTSAKSDAEGG
jgi:nucleotidyltransferase/DNA polymerase involved in DNA repair